MTDENETVAPPELDTPAIETEATIETETETETTELPQDVSETEESATEEAGEGGEDAEGVEYVTLERNGKQYQVPKDLEGEFLMQSDYTKKTQTVAEKAKELEQREAQIAQQAEATEEELDARATLRSVEKSVSDYDKLSPEDWTALEREDPMGAMTHWRTYQTLQRQRDEIAADLNSKQTARTEKAQQDLAKRVQETAEFAQKEIPGWKPELTDKLIDFARTEIGVPEDAIKANWSPIFYKLLYQASIGSQAMKRPTAPKPPAAPTAPLRTVTGKSTPAANKTLSEAAKGDDMEEYARLRAAGRVR